jgi:flavin reductase (DIM6/NTAB) family NADH-FMN oxidoreductase RutF
MTISQDEFRKTLGRFATGVTVITVAIDDGQVHGMTANAFTSVSLVPPLILVCIDHRARTLPLLHARERFGINVLRENQQALSQYYAQSEQDHESAYRLGVRYWHTDRGTPMLEECLAYLDCRVVSAYEAGDHTIFIGEVEQTERRQGRPLLFYAGKYQKLETTSL